MLGSIPRFPTTNRKTKMIRHRYTLSLETMEGLTPAERYIIDRAICDALGEAFMQERRKHDTWGGGTDIKVEHLLTER